MLKNLDDNIRKFLVCEDIDDTNRMLRFYSTNEFAKTVMQPLAEKCNVVVYKQSENTFVLQGQVSDVKAFLKELKCPKEYMEDPKEFKFFDPMFCKSETKEGNKNDWQIYPADATSAFANFKKYGVYDKNEFSTIIGGELRTWWFPVAEKDDNKWIKSIKPAEIDKKVFKKLDLKDDNFVGIMFQIEVGQHGNMSWGGKSSWAEIDDRK